MQKLATLVQKILPDKFLSQLESLSQEIPLFLAFLKIYSKDKLYFLSSHFERNKNTVVKGVLIRRGRRNRLFLHLSAMAILTVGVLVSPFISDSSLFTKKTATAQGFGGAEASLTTDDVFQTQASEKPRDKIISYTVQKGDTISTIAKKFGISQDTIKWQNNLTSDNITVGDTLDILPVTGIAHKVQSGDTVYTIAKKYSANAQAIVDYPFNDFANPQTFSLIEGQIIIVPDGVKPEEAPRYASIKREFVITGPAVITGEGFTWPVRGTFNQGFSWYHQAIDIGAPIGKPVVAAQSGVVAEVFPTGWNWGYGTYVIIQGDNGYRTLYAHMSGINVTPGQKVSAGATIVGWIGVTGRTTGPHLHFEIRGPGGNVNPLSFLQ